ncbi:MAG: DMT family transporter [Eubacterium sp.]|nr:DMT family transporter [Eubacterium sp.]
MKKTILTNTITVTILAAFCCLLWGSAFPCIKIGYSLFSIDGADTATQILFAGMRFTLAGVLTVIIGSLGAKKPLVPKREAFPLVLKLCLFQTILQYIFFYIGLAHTTGVKASIIEGSNVFFAIIAAALIFGLERLTVKKAVGCLLGFSGVVLVNMTGSELGALNLAGDGSILLSAVAYAISSSLIKVYSEKENPVTLSGWQFFIGGVVMIFAGLAFGGRITLVTVNGLLMLLYLAFVSAFAYSLWGVLLKYNPVSKIAVIGFTNPVFGVILSALLLNEGAQALSFNSAFALVLVCLGIIVVNFKHK